MKILLRNHGVSLAGVKADLYTVIGELCLVATNTYKYLLVGIDRNHPSGISSTVGRLVPLFIVT